MGRHIEKDTVEEELDPRTTLEIEAFLAWLDVQRGLSPTTQIAYGTDLRQMALFLAQRGASLARPAEVSKKHIQAWLARLYALGEAKSSMARKLAAARTGQPGTHGEQCGGPGAQSQTGAAPPPRP